MALLRMHFFIFLRIAIFINEISSQQLTAVRSKSNLTTPRERLSSVYDGDDKIYIYGGGSYGDSFSDLFTYTLSTDTIEVIADTGYETYRGELVRDGDGEIYFCGGYYNNTIMTYNQVKKTWSEVAPLSRQTYMFGLLQPSENTALIVGGADHNLDIVLFNMTDLTTTIVGAIPELPIADTTVAALYNENEAIVFQIPSSRIPSVFKYSLSTQSFTLLTDFFPRLLYPSLVYDGSHVYIVNGEYKNPDLYGGMIQVDPITANWTFIPVNNFPNPDSPDAYFYATSSVYVKKLNRIYMFGGYVAGYLNGIWWVDLDPLNLVTSTETPATTEPPFFDCSNKTDGMYPHPIYCNMFVACRFGEGDEFECPEPLLFDPIHLTCNAPNLVECDINCTGLSDGAHLHPRDCSLFLICEAGLVSVYSCPGDFLFDPIDLKCNFPDLVDCDV